MAEKFFVMVAPEHSKPYLRECDSLVDVARLLNKLPDTDRGFIVGQAGRVNITVAPWRFLIYGDQVVPVFDEPRPGKVDRSANFGQIPEDTEESQTYLDAMSPFRESMRLAKEADAAAADSAVSPPEMAPPGTTPDDLPEV